MTLHRLVRMRDNKGTIYSWLTQARLRKVVKEHGLNQPQFEALCLIKVIAGRVGREATLKDIKQLVSNAIRRYRELIAELEGMGLVSLTKSKGGWGKPGKWLISISPLGNELLYKIRQASESAIACLKYQLDNENSGLNKPKKVKKIG